MRWQTETGRPGRGSDEPRLQRGSVRRAAMLRHRRFHPRTIGVAALLAVLASVGSLSVGHGLYIYAKARLAQVLLADAFARSTATGRIVKPWSWADTWPVARIRVPRLGADMIALSSASGQAMAFGPGHVIGSAPIGAAGATLFSAHRDTHFAFVRHVVVGDVVEVTGIDGVRVSYQVTGTAVRRFDDVVLATVPGARHLVLTTCFPFDAITSGPHRYLVFATAIDD